MREGKYTNIISAPRTQDRAVRCYILAFVCFTYVCLLVASVRNDTSVARTTTKRTQGRRVKL